MNNKKIEKKAVKAVDTLFLDKSINIDPNLATDDTGISFDGNAIIFSNEETTKASYLNSIPVQVKGKIVDSFSKKIAKYNKFDKDTFKNFQYEDGVVVFLVEILRSNPEKKKIFYTFLDTMTLESILNELKDKKRKTKTIKLEKVKSSLDLDKEFRKIAIQRKVYGLKDAKLEGFLKNNSSMLFSNDYEKDIVEKASIDVAKYEYKNAGSHYNKKLQKDMKELLSQGLILDGFNLARVYGEIENLNLFNVLPESNLKLAYLIKARYLAMTKNFESAREVLQKFLNYFEEHHKEYDKILIESNLDSKEIGGLLDDSTLNNIEKAKYRANFFLENNNLNEFYELLPEKSLDDDWQYLYGKYLLLLQNYEGGIEILSKLNQSRTMVSIQYDLIQARFSYLENNLLFQFPVQIESDNNELCMLLDDIEAVRQKVEEVEYLEMPDLERLDFESKLLVNLNGGLDDIEKLLDSDEDEYDVQYLIEWKVKVLYLLNENQKVLNFISELPKEKISHNIIRFKVLTFAKKLAYKDSIEYIDELFKTLKFNNDKYLFNFLLSSYLIAINKYTTVDREKFDLIINVLIKKYPIDLPLLFQIENTRKQIGSENYGKAFLLILESFSDYPDTRKIQIARDFLYRNNELSFARKLYPYIAKINQQEADELLTFMYLINNMNEEALDVLEKYDNLILTEKMVILKAEALNNLGQFNATIQLYQHKKLSNHDYLTQILIAKNNVKDDEDIEIIIEEAKESNNDNFKLNAAVSLVIFGIDLALGIQRIEKHILKSRFNNTALNQIFLTLQLSYIKRFENNNSINLYNNVELKWYKFKRNESIREVVLVPEGWGIEKIGNIESYETNSDFKLLVQDLSVGESVIFDGDLEYSLIEEKPLSTFVFQELSKRESGELGSNKFLTQININSDNGGIENLVEFIKKFDNLEQLKLVQENYEKFRFPSIYGTVIPKNDIVEFYLELYNNTDTKYYVGFEENYSLNSNYLISISSMTFLASLNLLEILDKYPNVFLEKTQKIWLENKFNEEVESTKTGRLKLGAENNLVLNKRSENQEKILKETYRKLALTSRRINRIGAGLIEKEVNEVIKFDSSSAQAAIDEKMIFLCEDEALQKLFKNEYNTQVSSVGALISHYFLEIKNDVGAFIDILIKVIESQSAWLIQRSTFDKIYTITFSSSDSVMKNKFNNWYKLYGEYFSVPKD